MNPEERHQMLDSYGRAYDVLAEAISQFPREMWQFKPSPRDFSIHEVIVHIADSEANSYVRCRRCIAEPGESVMAYNEVAWASALGYHDQSTDDALDLFRSLRAMTFRLVKTVPDAVWAHTIQHPENGRMTLDDWLRVYAAHVPDHIQQMRDIHAAWQAANAVAANP